MMLKSLQGYFSAPVSINQSSHLFESGSHAVQSSPT